MGIKTVPQSPYSPDLAPSDFSLFPKLTGCPYETIEEMKEAVTRVIDTLTQEDFHGARGVMVIVAGIGHGDTSSNPGLIAFHIALIPLGKV